MGLAGTRRDEIRVRRQRTGHLGLSLIIMQARCNFSTWPGTCKSACEDKGGDEANVTVIASLEGTCAYRIECCAACDSHPADHRHVCMAHLPQDNEHQRVVMG